MESYNNQSFNESFGFDTEEVPLFVTYLNMAFIIVVIAIVVTPAMMVINVIWWTKELHTKYFFFVANLLATDTVSITVRGILQYLIMIIYLLDKNSDFAHVVVKRSILLLVTILHLMTVQLPTSLAIERMVVIGYPYRHRSIMTFKTAASILAAMWGLSAILSTAIIIIVPIDIVWPLALVDWDIPYVPFIVTLRITSTVFIIVTIIFLQYKVTIANRKARENARLGNEEEAKRFRKLAQLLKAQAKATMTLFLMGGIDVIGNILIPTLYVVIGLSVTPLTKVYIEQFFLYPLRAALLLSHSLIYGLYMKKIRRRLPWCTAFQRLWHTRHSKVTFLHRQP